jgi:TonB family protein
MRTILTSAFVLLLLWSARSFGADKPAEINPEVQRALEVSDIRHSKTSSLHLFATITITPENKDPLQGKYVFVKNSDGKWREELILPGYRRLRVGDEHNYWQVRNAEYDSLLIQNIDELLDFPRQLSVEKKQKFTKLPKMKKDGSELFCQQTKKDPIHVETICFDQSNGALIYRDNGMTNFQSTGKVSSARFSDFHEITDKRFPTSLRGFSGKKLLVDIHVDELKEGPDSDSTVFTTPAGASRWLYCPLPAGSKMKNRIQPIYPQAFRNRGEQGVVTFYGLIGEDGKISKLFLIQSAGADLDKSAAAAVSQWVYEQPLCDGVPGPLESTIDIIFTLQP